MLGLGLLRRLLLGESSEAHDDDTAEPEAAERIEAARRRLKDTIPAPDDDPGP